MIDLKNTWCEATEENYNALKNIINPINFKGIKEGYAKGITHYFIIYENLRTWVVNTTSQGLPNGKQIRLVNGEFQYVETKPKNNFKDYGFEADFEGEIYTEDEAGLLIAKVEGDGVYFDSVNGNCFKIYTNERLKHYDLKPIKKEWYENPDNIGKFISINNTLGIFKSYAKENETIIYISLVDNLEYIIHISKCRPATKEEVLALLIKE